MNVFERFREAAAMGPERVAVRSPRGELTYRQLEEHALRTAALLGQTRSLGPGPIGVALDPDPELFALCLGVVASGRPYVYVDPRSPAVEQAAVLRNARAAAWFSSADASAGGLPCLSPAAIGGTRLDGAAAVPVPPGAPCILVRTSGSTADPKGFVLSHGTVLHHNRIYRSSLRLGPGDRVALANSPRFAAANSPTYGALLAGAALLPFPVRDLGLAAWIEWLADQRITVLHLTPSLFRGLAHHVEPGALPHLRMIKLGGETAFRADAELFERQFPGGCELVNGLGLSEVGGALTHHVHVRGTHRDAVLLPVGPTNPGIELWIENTEGEPAPAGDAGEIVVRSTWLASGTWHQADPDPNVPKELRTGDRGRFLPDGSLLHLGRMDRLVKTRGQQVDLDAIEAALLRVDGVRNAAVDSDPGPPPTIRAWVETEDRMTPTRITETLRRCEPGTHIPHRILCVRAIPLTSGGKADRRALRALTADRPKPPATPPRTDFEIRVAAVWQAVLGDRTAGVYDSFFELGGDSMQALELLAGLSREFDRHCKPDLLLTCPNIAELAEALAGDFAGGERLPVARRFEATLQPIHSTGPGLTVASFPGGNATESELLLHARLLARSGVACTGYGIRFNATARRTLVLSIRPALRKAVAALWDRARGSAAPVVFIGECIAAPLAIEAALRFADHQGSLPAVILLDPFYPRPPDAAARRQNLLPDSPIESYLRLARDFPPPRFPGRLEIFCAERPDRASECADWWQSHTGAECRVLTVRGDHYSYLRADADDLAGKLGASLAATLAASTAEIALPLDPNTIRP